MDLIIQKISQKQKTKQKKKKQKKIILIDLT